MISDAKRKANTKWNKAHMETLGLTLKVGVKSKLKTIVESSEQSLTSFMLDAFIEKAIREKLITREQAETLKDEDPDGDWIKGYTRIN